MAIRDDLKATFKISFKTFINPAAWFGWGEFKNNTSGTWRLIKSGFTLPKESTTPESREASFKTVAAQNKLTENDLRLMVKNYRLYALIFTGGALLSFFYTAYLVFSKFSFSGLMLGTCCSILFLSFAFKYDFYALQVSQRRLGLTFQEWINHFFGK